MFGAGAAHLLLGEGVFVERAGPPPLGGQTASPPPDHPHCAPPPSSSQAEVPDGPVERPTGGPSADELALLGIVMFDVTLSEELLVVKRAEKKAGGGGSNGRSSRATAASERVPLVFPPSAIQVREGWGVGCGVEIRGESGGEGDTQRQRPLENTLQTLCAPTPARSMSLLILCRLSAPRRARSWSRSCSCSSDTTSWTRPSRSWTASWGMTPERYVWRG